MWIIILLFLSSCATHPGTFGFCIDEFNFITNTLPFLQGYYDWLHNKFHGNKKEDCHLDGKKNKRNCCGKEMVIVNYEYTPSFWIEEDGIWKFYKSSIYMCTNCKVVLNLAKEDKIIRT